MRKALAACGLMVMASFGYCGDEVAAVRRDLGQLIDATRAERDRLNAECDGHVKELLAEIERQKGSGEEPAARKAALDQLRALHAKCVEKRQALAQRFATRKDALMARMPEDQRGMRIQPPAQFTAVDAAP